MHLYVAARGQSFLLEKWKSDLQGMVLPYEIYNKETKKKEMKVVEFGVRPIQLLEIVFPEPMMEKALRVVAPNKSSFNPKYNKYINWIKKKLGLTDIPEYPKSQGIPSSVFIDVTGIGMKKDEYDEHGIERL